MTNFADQKTENMNLSQSQYIDQANNNCCTINEYIDSTNNTPPKEFIISDSISGVVGVNATAIAAPYQDNSSIYNDQDNLLNSGCSYILIAATVVLYTIILTIHKKYNAPFLRTFSYKDRLERIATMLEVNFVKYINIGSILFYIVTSHILNLSLNRADIYHSRANWKIIATIFALFTAINLYRLAIDKSIAYLTNNKMFSSSQNIFRKSFNTLISITLAPLALLFVYAPEVSFDIVIHTLSLLSFVSIIAYWRMLFVNLSIQNFSFLEYILYLCSAEIIPTLTIIVVLYRNIA